MRVTLKQMEVFVAVAQEGTVLKAAERLKVTQSAASMSLADFERQLEQQLFDRVGRRIVLNDIGRQFLPKVLDILARAEEIEHLAGNALQSKLRIGASLTIGNYLIPTLIGRFMRDHPGSQLSLDVGNTRHVIDQLEKFHIDIGFIEGFCHSPDIDVIPWRQDELVIFAGMQHPLAGKAEVDIEELSRVEWILREPGSGTREVFDNAVMGKLLNLRLVLELGHTEAIKLAVESGLGVGCLSGISLKEAFERGSLCPIPTPYLDLRRQFYILVHRQKYRSLGLEAFLASCQQSVTDQRIT